MTENEELDKLEALLEQLRARQAARAEKEREAMIASLSKVRAEAMRPESIFARKRAREEAKARADELLSAPVTVRFGGLARRGLFTDDSLEVVAPAAETFDVKPTSDARFVTITAARSDLLGLAVRLRATDGEPQRRASKCIEAAVGRLGPGDLRKVRKVAREAEAPTVEA